MLMVWLIKDTLEEAAIVDNAELEPDEYLAFFGEQNYTLKLTTTYAQWKKKLGIKKNDMIWYHFGKGNDWMISDEEQYSRFIGRMRRENKVHLSTHCGRDELSPDSRE